MCLCVGVCVLVCLCVGVCVLVCLCMFACVCIMCVYISLHTGNFYFDKAVEGFLKDLFQKWKV